MSILRSILLLACLGCLAVVAWSSRWEGYLTRGNHAWIIDLGRAPIWAPPPDPPYARFREAFKESEGFPFERSPGLTIQRRPRLGSMAVDLLFYLWLVTVICGLIYLAIRGERRDLILQLGLSAGIGLTASAAACIALWLLFGGWGPPAPEFFGGLGLVVGIIVGLRSFKRVRRRAESIPTRHGVVFAEVDSQNDGRVGI